MAATPSLPVKPRTTPIAKMSGRIVKIASPADLITCPISTSHGARPWAPAREAPTPRRMPATGRTDTGSISALPIFWSTAKVPSQSFLTVSSLLIFMVPSPVTVRSPGP